LGARSRQSSWKLSIYGKSVLDILLAPFMGRQSNAIYRKVEMTIASCVNRFL
jgi:hypothetical protein